MNVKQAGPRGLGVIIGVLIFAAVLTALYWVLFFSGSGAAVTNDPRYLAFEYAFPAADAWMAIGAVIGAVGLLRHRSWGVLFALLAGSASIYLGLMDVLFDLENGIYLLGGVNVDVEVVINVLTLGLGSALIWYVWSRRSGLL